MTTKLQVTLPKAVADLYGIRAGDEIEWVPAGDVIRVLPPGQRHSRLDVTARLKLFDQATARQQQREEIHKKTKRPQPKDRGWTREDLYARGRAR
ncbi:MAG: AbrB/MazE/SpoVT family DNA-binding domain-containing protein [Acidobacteria bacterium]|nr:AbrB/MazE/SpoVT family DNA-binding domain-containing protein [Acidobacteriota bacterium]